MKVYVLTVDDAWNEVHYIRDIFATREAALADLMDSYDDIIYRERYDYYERSNPDSTVLFHIYEYTVKGK